MFQATIRAQTKITRKLAQRYHHQHHKNTQQCGSRVSIFRGKEEFSQFVIETQSVRFKVHRPGCQCSKIVNIKNLIEQNQHQSFQKDDDDDHHHHQQQQHVPTDGGFLILPECKWMQSIFVGGEANSQSYLKDPLPNEMTLHDVLFPLPQSIHGTPIKISCAQCMLQVEPNGFVCIISSCRTLVENARNMANDSKHRYLENKSKGGLHSDHADYISVLGLNTLQKSLSCRGYNHNRNMSKNRHDLHHELVKQNVPIRSNTSIKIGHHLNRAIDFFKDRKKEKDNNEDIFILTTIIQTMHSTGRVVLDIDIPGGKRHLGESSLECALRETLEETSLSIERSWIVDVEHPLRSQKSPDESCNVFYEVVPPTPHDDGSNGVGGSENSTSSGGKKNDGLDDILSNVFWTNTGLDAECSKTV